MLLQVDSVQKQILAQICVVSKISVKVAQKHINCAEGMPLQVLSNDLNKILCSYHILHCPKFSWYPIREKVGMKLGAHFQTRLALALAFLSHMLGEDTQAHNRGAGKTRIVVEHFYHMLFPYTPDSLKARILVWVLPLQFSFFFS